jgi:hypothetical protein
LNIGISPRAPVALADFVQHIQWQQAAQRFYRRFGSF